MQVAYVTVLPPFSSTGFLQAFIMKLHKFHRLIDKQYAEL